MRIESDRFGYYFAGFVDGEGSFNVSLKRNSSHQTGWQLEPSFNVSQKDRVILALLKQHLGCGTLRERPDGVVYYEVRNIRALQEVVVPFFERYRFLSASKKLIVCWVVLRKKEVVYKGFGNTNSSEQELIDRKLYI